MGYYIQTSSNFGKAGIIAKQWDGRIVSTPPSFDSLQESNEVLIAVLDNGFFEAAGICFSKDEQAEFCNPRDLRPKKFVVLSKLKAVEAYSSRKEDQERLSKDMEMSE